ncbi:MAG TPA: hypothetical protein PLW93_06290, partial [Candidatus Absconditabacterales bacterium]|nr:hypothetical protein [Candidatus Absconditabacterales bacterium]
MKQNQSAELFLTGPISSITDQMITLYDPLTQESAERMLLNAERNWSLLFFYPADFSYVCPTELAKLSS